MTNAEEAELRGEIFGLKILVMNLISRTAGVTEEDRTAFLDALVKQSGAGIVKATNSAVKPAFLNTFHAAAMGIVLQCADAARVTPQQAPPLRPLQ
jgi:hypothetical protein